MTPLRSSHAFPINTFIHLMKFKGVTNLHNMIIRAPGSALNVVVMMMRHVDHLNTLCHHALTHLVLCRGSIHGYWSALIAQHVFAQLLSVGRTSVRKRTNRTFIGLCCSLITIRWMFVLKCLMPLRLAWSMCIRLAFGQCGKNALCLETLNAWTVYANIGNESWLVHRTGKFQIDAGVLPVVNTPKWCWRFRWYAQIAPAVLSRAINHWLARRDACSCLHMETMLACMHAPNMILEFSECNHVNSMNTHTSRHPFTAPTAQYHAKPHAINNLSNWQWATHEILQPHMARKASAASRRINDRTLLVRLIIEYSLRQRTVTRCYMPFVPLASCI